jgi:hypothetical protein
MIRRKLPPRSASETFTVRFWGQAFAVTTGFFPDGTVGEVFISGAKSGQDALSIACDAAILLSLGLQHGTPIENIRRAVTRGSRGEPTSIVGAIVDALPTTGRGAA